MNPYVLLGVAVILAISHGFAFVKGRGWERAEWAAKVAEQTAKARETEQAWQGAADAIVKNLGAKQAATQRSLDLALDSLRARPDRPVSDASRADCKGATGAELYRADGEFLAREAARADRHRAALEACYTYADTLTTKRAR